jgi:CheY-like chemotaxis protein
MEDAHVLIVDDDYLSQKLLTLLLQSAGCEQVSTASTAAEALRMIEGTPPNLMVLDLALPDMNGVDLARRVRMNPGSSDTVIFVVSADSGLQTQREAMDAGCNEYFVKPIDSKAFLDCATRYLGSTGLGA